MERFERSFEEQYVQLGLDILRHGTKIPTRTGVDCITLDHGYIQIPNGVFPMLLGKKLYPKMALKEIVWFLLGRNDVQWLRDHGVAYWNEWEIKTSERAKQLNLDDSWIGTIGKSYGYQWRNFGSTGCNQVHNLIEGIVKDPLGRRHIISSWCPPEFNQMALPPCVYDWNVQLIPENTLYQNTYTVHIHTKARSIDYFLGLPYDMLQAYWFQQILVDILNAYSGVIGSTTTYNSGNLHFNIDNFHIYANHVDKVHEYIQNAQKSLTSKKYPFTNIVLQQDLSFLDVLKSKTLVTPSLVADKYINNFKFDNEAVKIIHLGYDWNELPVIKAEVAI